MLSLFTSFPMLDFYLVSGKEMALFIMFDNFFSYSNFFPFISEYLQAGDCL